MALPNDDDDDDRFRVLRVLFSFLPFSSSGRRFFSSKSKSFALRDAPAKMMVELLLRLDFGTTKTCGRRRPLRKKVVVLLVKEEESRRHHPKEAMIAFFVNNVIFTTRTTTVSSSSSSSSERVLCAF